MANRPRREGETEPDLYATLGVPRSANDAEIRKAYRKLAREHHPDVNPGDKAAEERFKQISFANDVLSDAEKRKRYDEFGLEGLAEGFDPEQARAYRHWSEGARRSPGGGFGRVFDLEDLFGDLLRGRERAGPLRGGDLEAEIEVDFLAAVRAEEVRVSAPGRSSLRVRLPRGATDGTRVRLAGQGQTGADGGEAGDLYLSLRVRPHLFYRRTGDDLELDLPVTLPEAIRGASVSVPTPYGVVTMKVPPRAQQGQRLRLRGKGAAKRASQENGDLFVRLKVELPESTDPKLDEIAAELEPFYTGRNPREELER